MDVGAAREVNVDEVDAQTTDEERQRHQREGEPEDKGDAALQLRTANGRWAPVEPECRKPFPACLCSWSRVRTRPQIEDAVSVVAQTCRHMVHDAADAAEVVPRDDHEDVHAWRNGGADEWGGFGEKKTEKKRERCLPPQS